ncbi:hypothetical protein ACH5RR_027675 [Cinchona calisaya]|uniref:Secreted protein n=1 Tax=Cinchona calisaya TaxID=153742 RepID=A0ABD2YLK4_9GENT
MPFVSFCVVGFICLAKFAPLWLLLCNFCAFYYNSRAESLLCKRPDFCFSEIGYLLFSVLYRQWWSRGHFLCLSTSNIQVQFLIFGIVGCNRNLVIGKVVLFGQT